MNVLLLTVALEALQASLCLVPFVINLLQNSLSRTTIHSLNDTQVPWFGNLGELLVLEVDCDITVGVEHQHLSSTDELKLPSAKVLCEVDLMLKLGKMWG